VNKQKKLIDKKNLLSGKYKYIYLYW